MKNTDFSNLPVLVVAWRRPSTTERLIGQLWKLGVERVYARVDGPRPSVLTDSQDCQKTRSAIERYSDVLDLSLSFSDHHLGLKNGVTTAITWFLENEPHGLVLEDDIWPTRALMQFVSHHLELNGNQKAIGQVSGTYYAAGAPPIEKNSYLSAFSHVWGFGLWRDRWAGFPDFLASTEPISAGELEELLPGFSTRFYKHWERRRNRELLGLDDTWASSWQVFNWKLKRDSITPSSCLVTNVGFGDLATNSVRVPLIAGVLTPATEFPYPGKFDAPSRGVTSRRHDLYVSLTQWNTQSPLLRLLFGCLELVRRIPRRLAKGKGFKSQLRPNDFPAGYRTLAQEFFLWRIFATRNTRLARPGREQEISILLPRRNR